MTSLAELLALPDTQRTIAAASDTFAAMTPADQQAQREDGTKTIALTGVLADEWRAGLASESSRERARKAHDALVKVEARVTRRVRRVRRHASRVRGPKTTVVKIMVARPRARQRSDGPSRRRRASPDKEGEKPGRGARRRGHSDAGWGA